MEDEMEEIWALYADDGAQALDIAEGALVQIAQGEGTERAEGISALFRAVHTFKGNSRVLGLQVAESRAHLTEDLIGLVRDHGAPWDAEVESLMLLAVDRLRVILEQTAASRADVDEGFATDLMEGLAEKIARIGTQGASAPEMSAPPVPPSDAAPPSDGAEEPEPVLEPEPGDHGAERVPEQPPLSDTVPEAPQDFLPLILGILGALPPSPDDPQRAGALGRIARLAQEAGYLRLGDLAEELVAGTGENTAGEIVRLYEELYAIELSRGEAEVPAPRPRDLLCGWCAEHAFALIDELRALVERLGEGREIENSLRRIEPVLRRINAACDYHGLSDAALLAMSLLDLVLRVSPDLGRSKHGPDETVIRMLRTFISTVELALDAAREGETPDTALLDELTAASNQFDFLRSGAPPAPQALETLNLPGQFLRVMSPRSVLLAQKAAASGMRFQVVRAAFPDDPDQAERFFAQMEDGRIRQITSVSVLADAAVRFDFLLATDLAGPDFAARLAKADPGGQVLTLLTAEEALSAADALAPVDGGAGVSVEMMEMLGEVSSGLASVIKDLRLSTETEGLTVLFKTLAQNGGAAAQTGRALRAEMGRVGERVEHALLTLDHLSRRVAALQEEAMISRLRPADFVLRPLADQLRRQAQEAGHQAEVRAEIAAVPLDRQTLEILESACENHATQRFSLAAGAPLRLALVLRQRDDRVILTIDDTVATPPDPAALQHLSRLCAECGGKVWMGYDAGGGCRVVISVPTRMLAMEGMVVTSAGIHYVMPVDALVMVVRAKASQVMRRAAAGAERFLTLDDGAVLPIHTLEGGNADAGGLFLIVQAEETRKAVLVDSLIGQEVVRLRPLQGVMARLDRLAGMAVLAGGEVALVLSPLAICGRDQDLALPDGIAPSVQKRGQGSLGAVV